MEVTFELAFLFFATAVISVAVESIADVVNVIVNILVCCNCG